MRPVLLLVLLLAACAPPAPPVQSAAAPGQAALSQAAQCFRPGEIRNFRADGATDLYVRTLRNGVYQLQTSGGCWGLDAALSVAVTPTAGASRLCVGDTVDVAYGAGRPGPCRARIARLLSPDQVAALPGRVRP